MIRIEIEKLLQWALREEMPKGHPVSASAWDTITRFALLGTRVDVSVFGGGDGLGFVPGEPHPDAIIVGEAVRRLPASISFTATECEALLDHYAALDPLAIKAIAGSNFSPRALVIRCAVLGERMPYDVGVPCAAPSVRRDRRQLAVAFARDDDGVLCEAKANGRGNYPTGAATHITWHEPSIGQLLEARVEYAVWHRALVLVQRDLGGANMKEYVALPPTSRAAPWITGQVPEPIVHKSSAKAHAGVLPLVPARPRSRPPVEAGIVRANRLDAARRRGEARKKQSAKTADKTGVC